MLGAIRVADLAAVAIAQAWEISAIGILEAHPLIRRRVDDLIRELVISRERPDIALSIVSIPYSTPTESCKCGISEAGYREQCGACCLAEMQAPRRDFRPDSTQRF
jgi:hypothetical protein